MNKNSVSESKESGIKGFFQDGKFKDVLLLILLGLALVFFAWKIFQEDKVENAPTIALSETEERVARLLEEIDGVGNASVIVYETNDEIESVVVVCEGANNLRVVMNVREAVAAALGTQEKSIKIFLKK